MMSTATETRIAVPQERIDEARGVIDEFGGTSATLAAQTPSDQLHRLPRGLAEVLEEVVRVLAAGGTVTVGGLPNVLTTTMAANLLRISRPTLMKLIQSGELASHRVGSHHRLNTSDVLAFREARRTKQRQAFQELLEMDLA